MGRRHGRAHRAAGAAHACAPTTTCVARAAKLNDLYLGGLAVPASVRWVTNQNARWGSCTPGDRSIRLSDRLQKMPGWVVDYVLVHELAHLLESGHTPAFWAWVDRYPRAEQGQGLPRGLLRGRPARAAPGRRRGLSRGLSRRRTRATAASMRTYMSSNVAGSASTGHQRTSSDSSLVAWAASRLGGGQEPHVEVVDGVRGRSRTPPRARRGRAAPGRSRATVSPDSSMRLAQGAAGQRGVAGLEVAAEGEPRVGLAVVVEQHRVGVGGDDDRAGGEVVGEARLGQAVGVRGRGGRGSGRAARACAGVGGDPPRQRGDGASAWSAHSAGRRAAVAAVEQVAQPGVELLLGQLARAPPSPRGSPAGRRGRRRWAAGAATSRRRRGPRCPGGCAASPRGPRRRAAGGAAARGRRGWRRSARPVRPRRAGGVRSPAAWPRPASARRWPG